jgi:hypothetical protein
MSVITLETCWTIDISGITNSVTELHLVGDLLLVILGCTVPWILNLKLNDLEWMYLAWDRHWWTAVVNTEMNIRATTTLQRISWLNSQKGLVVVKPHKKSNLLKWSYIICYLYRVSSYIQYIDQQIYLIKYSKIQTTKHDSWSISFQHVSAPECHLQGVYEHKVSQVQHSTSGMNHPNCHLCNIKMLTVWSTYIWLVYSHTAVTPKHGIVRPVWAQAGSRLYYCLELVYNRLSW